MNIFKKKRYIPLNSTVQPDTGPSVPDGAWTRCANCGKTVYVRSLGAYKKCPDCACYFRLSAFDRIALTADEGTFVELDAGLKSLNPLEYPGYEGKLEATEQKTGINEAVVTGECAVEGERCAIGVMDSRFFMGSMGSVVGEKLTRIFEYAAGRLLPVVIFTASGGARMQEGIISLMQMAKVAAAVKRHSDKGLFYLTVLTDPTTGGVTASFAMLGDIIIAEPGALIGFAGRRVIEQTIKQRLPEDFQTAEFLLEHGFVDKIVTREEMKGTIAALLSLHGRTV